MRTVQDSVHIETADETEAIQEATRLLGVPAKEILLSRAADGGFKAVRKMQSPVKVVISEDGLRATASLVASELDPAVEGGVSRAAVMRAIAEAGVKVTPIASAIDAILDAAAVGAAVEGVVVAKGSPPTKAVNAAVTPRGDWRYPVLPGEVLGVIEPARDAKPGMKVTGERAAVEGESTGRPIRFSETPYCRIDKNSYSVRSETYGMVSLSQGELEVVPAFQALDNGFLLKVDIHHRDNDGETISPDRLRQALAMLGFVVGFKEERVAKALAVSKKTDKPQLGVTVCEGRPPIHGEDGWFELLYEDLRSKVGAEGAQGAIDFKERGVVRSVQKGELIGVLHPPTVGVPGKDIYGRVSTARDGQPFELATVEHVDVLEDGRTYYATEAGMVFLKGNVLTVTDVYRTDGDVDMSVGNLSLEKGSIHVRGSILAGFAVRSPANILVDEVVEGAEVVAEGSVQVAGGLLMDGKGRITAGQDVSAHFMKDAIVHAGGDVYVNHEIANSMVEADGKVKAVSGRGKILGGTIRAGRLVEANEIGNEMGVGAAIHLGRELVLDPALLERRAELKELLKKIYGKLGSDSPKAVLLRTPESQRESVGQLLKTRLSAEKELQSINERIQELKAAHRKDASAQVRVRKTLHAGVVIHGFGACLTIEQAEPACRIFFDRTLNRFVVGKM